MAKTVDKISVVRVYNTYIPHDSQLCMSKNKAYMHEYGTRIGKFKQVYRNFGYGNGVRPSTIMTA